jgi:cell wall assembly regulator SMI1
MSTDAVLRELVEVAREQLRWQQAATLPEVRETLATALATTEMRRVYEMCDGQHTFREMAAEVGVALSTIAKWTKRWREAALVHEADAGRMQQLVSLEAIGIPTEVTADSAPSRSKRG